MTKNLTRPWFEYILKEQKIKEERGTAVMEKQFEVLLIDDNTADIELTKEAFAENEINIGFHFVMNAEKAMLFLKKEGEYVYAPKPDIILLDINIPGKSGLEFLNEIKSGEEFRHIPVIMLTSSGAEKDIRESYKLHANCYITKPAEFEEFLRIIRLIKEFWFETVKMQDDNA